MFTVIWAFVNQLILMRGSVLPRAVTQDSGCDDTAPSRATCVCFLSSSFYNLGNS